MTGADTDPLQPELAGAFRADPFSIRVPAGIDLNKLAALPEVASFAAISKEAEIETTEIVDRHTESLRQWNVSLSRKNRRLGESHYENTYAEVLRGLLAVYCHEEDGEQRRQHIEAHLRPHFRRSPRADVQIRHIAEAADAAITAYRSQQPSIEKVGTQVAAQTDNEPRNQYEAVKIITGMRVAHDERPDGIKTLAVMLAIYEVEHEPLLQSFAKKLEEGTYDPFIAADMVRHVAEAPEKAEKLQATLRAWHFLRQCSPEVDEAEMRLRFAETTEFWPAEAKLELLEQRRKIATLAKQNIARLISNVLNNGEAVRPGAESNLDQAIRDWKDAIAKYMHPSRRIDSRDEIMRIRVARKRAGKPAVAQVVEPQAVEEQEDQPTLRLGAIDKSGIIYDDEDVKLNEIKDDYVAEHRGAPNLEQDIESIFDYLRKLNLSNGPVRGLKKYGGQFATPEGKFDVYAFKPTDAVGLPLSSVIAKKIRVLFTRSGDVIAIFAITDRDKLPTVERQFGIRTSSRA